MVVVLKLMSMVLVRSSHVPVVADLYPVLTLYSQDDVMATL